MRDCIMTKLHYLIQAKAPIIWVNTYEEAAFINDICEYIEKSDTRYELYTWTNEGNLDFYDTASREIDETTQNVNPPTLFGRIKEEQNNTDKNSPKQIYILKDMHALLENASIKRQIRTLKEYRTKKHVVLIFMSPITSIPMELEKLITVFNYDLPERNEVESIVNNLISVMKNKAETDSSYEVPKDEDKNAIVNALLGLTRNEIAFLLTKSTVEFKKINVDAISQSKIELVQKTGLLNYIVPHIDFSEIGGNSTFKQWIEDIEFTFSDDAKEFGCESPKGYLSLGIAGTGKTIMAEAIAKKWGYPLLVFDVSKIYDKLIGESEKRIEKAFRIIKSCAPCVLLFDEAEKIFGGFSASDCDAGTSSRVFSSILRFLAENDNVFVIMTSNDVTRLPPELMRSGRIDTMWYFGFPTEDERKDIFRIHFAKTGHPVEDTNILDQAVRETNNYTGAEIKNIVKQSIWQTYKQFKQTGNSNITIDSIKYAISKVSPVYKTNKEKILALESYAKERALFANSKNKKDSVADDINDLMNLF